MPRQRTHYRQKNLRRSRRLPAAAEAVQRGVPACRGRSISRRLGTYRGGVWRWWNAGVRPGQRHLKATSGPAGRGGWNWSHRPSGRHALEPTPTESSLRRLRGLNPPGTTPRDTPVRARGRPRKGLHRPGGSIPHPQPQIVAEKPATSKCAESMGLQPTGVATAHIAPTRCWCVRSNEPRAAPTPAEYGTDSRSLTCSGQHSPVRPATEGQG